MWCTQKNIWLSCFHIAGLSNICADALSRQKLNPDSEWGLDGEIFKKIMSLYGNYGIDMFASARNKKNYHVMFPICRTVTHLQLMHFLCAGTSIIHTYFPLFLYWQCTSKDIAIQGRGSNGSTTISNTALVSKASSDGSDTALSVTQTRDNSNPTRKQYKASTEKDDIE